MDRQGWRRRRIDATASLAHAAVTVRAADVGRAPGHHDGARRLRGMGVLSFLESPHGALEGLTPRQAVEQGQAEQVRAIAEHDGR